ncbi:hypothetical protein BD847_3861 [Flavobacterium cutihirudinis]|uniref:Methyltransferase family protein n=1 Tax=Flavobacterium cutihirudinis TaxID=1265740 RepID=A0A3D9FK66_9FLAO|nr:hypothetical protein [Flavobacterium cutihirudinis]RED19574.1 hypothetical protein BD847_3861 [Flavobacterium cutihirudinis]
MISKLVKLFSLNHYFDKVARNVYDVNANVILHRLFPHETILPFTTFSLNPGTILHIINEIQINSRKSIIEFGSGISTIILARYISENNLSIRISSIESNESWLGFIDKQLEMYNCRHVVDLCYAPLKSNSNYTTLWYNDDKVSEIIKDKKFDLVIVDGPSGGLGKFARKPALNAIINHIDSNFSIFLDDVRRPDESQILEEWYNSLKNANFKVKMISLKSRVYGILTSEDAFSSNPLSH